MRHRKLFFLYVIAVVGLFFVPNLESFIFKVLAIAGVVAIVARGLKGHYDDFADTLNGNSNADKKGNL